MFMEWHTRANEGVSTLFVHIALLPTKVFGFLLINQDHVNEEPRFAGTGLFFTLRFIQKLVPAV